MGLLHLCSVSIAQIRSVIEVILASLASWSPVVESVDVLKQSEKYVSLTLVDLLLCPCELLAHLAVCLEYFEGFSDV